MRLMLLPWLCATFLKCKLSAGKPLFPPGACALTGCCDCVSLTGAAGREAFPAKERSQHKPVLREREERKVFGDLVNYFQQGGIVMWPLLVFSLLTVTFIVERGLALRKAKVNVNEFLSKVRKALLVNRDVRAAMKVCEEYQGPVASVVKAALARYGHPKEDIEKNIESAAVFESARLERGLMVLATSANISPMMGFLGTVTGMIKSFATLAQAGLSNPGAVAAGISEALITTATGLFIAIPAQLGYNYFMSRINKFMRDIEVASNMLMDTFIEMDSERYGAGGGAEA
jgi:biopolymer transport protein ExbB